MSDKLNIEQLYWKVKRDEAVARKRLVSILVKMRVLPGEVRHYSKIFAIKIFAIKIFAMRVK